MAKVVVFDSGLGSLSIIKPIQKITKCEIIYFADQKNFPYGKKSKSELRKIINDTMKNLNEKFHPDFIIVGSNTPTLMLNIESRKVIGIKPPLNQAAKASKTNSIGVLSTRAAVESKGMSDYIKRCNLPKFKIKKINSSELVNLVETGKFLTNQSFCKKIIKKNLQKDICNNKIDVCTLSSTHLPFLKKLLQEEFPNVCFIDPAQTVAKQISKKIKSDKNSLKIFSSGNIKGFQKNLKRLGIKNKVTFLSF